MAARLPQSGTPPADPSAALGPIPSPSPDRRILFWALGLSAAFLLVALVATSDVGLTTDERIQQEFGRQLWSYYSTFGRDLRVLDLRNLRYYGGLFDLLGFLAARAVGAHDPLWVRHALCALCGAIGVYFSVRLASRLGGTRSGIVAGLLLAVHPRWFGNALFDSKDIPFAAGYTAALYSLVRLAEELPGARLTRWLQFALAAAGAMSVRIGGILLVALAGVAAFAAELSSARRSPGTGAPGAGRALWAWAGAAILAYGITLLFWPYLLQAPLAHLVEVVRMASRFHWHGQQLFRGEFRSVEEIGRAYLPTWLMLTTPPVVLAGGALWLVVGSPPTPASPRRRSVLVLLVVAAALPPALAIALRSVLYDGIRHFLFILPPLCVLAALGWSAALARWQASRAARAVVLGLLVVGLGEPAYWLVRSHPYEYAYFAPQSGGFARASTAFPTDYWFVSSRTAAAALDRLAAALPPGETLSVSCQNLFLIAPQLAPETRSRLTLTALRMGAPADLEVLFADRILRRRIDLDEPFLVQEKLVASQVPFFVVRDLRCGRSHATPPAEGP